MATQGPRREPARTLTYVEVSLREIEALYDVGFGRALTTSSSGEPELVDGQPGLGRMEWRDREARPVPPPGVAGGVFCRMATRGGGWVDRTFRRDRSGEVKDKCVYVFAARSAAGDGGRLVHELRFGSDGRFRAVDLAKHAGLDERPVGAAASRRFFLSLDAIDAAGWRPAAWFFHLAPYPLPWEAVERLSADLAARAVRLGDDFHTDAHPPDRPGEQKTLLQVTRGAPPDGQLAFVLHLPDAFKEGLRRARLHEEALERLSRKLEQKWADRRYVLAKRIDAMTSANAALRTRVQKKLDAYVRDADRELRWLEWSLLWYAADLTRWIGREERRAPAFYAEGTNAPVLVFEVEGRNRWFRGPPPGTRPVFRDEPWTNAFSSTARDYVAAPQEVRDEASLVVAAVHERLGESAAGRAWLKDNLPRVTGEGDSLADGGVKLVVNPKDKRPKAISSALGIVLAAYADFWADRYKEEALEKFERWLFVRCGAEFEALPRAERRAIRADERRAWKRARKLPLSEVKLKPEWVKDAEVAKDVVKTLEFALKALAVAHALKKLGSEPRDPWKWAEATGAIAEAYDALAKLRGKPIEVKLYGHLTKLKAVGPIAVATGVLSLAAGIRDVAAAEDSGEKVGRSISATGSAVAIAGAFAATTLGIAIPIAIGVGLQMTGKWVEEEFSDAARFLRNCAFGEKDGVAGAYESLASRVEEDWYKGDLSALATDVGVQHRALDQILYDFEPQVRSTRAGLALGVKLRNPSQLTDVSRWHVKVVVPHRGEPRPREHRVSPELFTADGEDERTLWAPLVNLDVPTIGPADRPAPPPRLRASCLVRLDVFDDGKVVVERTCKERGE